MELSYWDVRVTPPRELLSRVPTLVRGCCQPRNRELTKLFSHLRKHTDYCESPASRRFHHAYCGGLLQHSLEVVALMFELNTTLKAKLSYDSIVTCGLLHDVGKVNTYGVADEGYVHMPRQLEVAHGVLSLLRTNTVRLSQAEAGAILYHDGMYVEMNRSHLPDNETPLLLVLHWADMWSARSVGHAFADPG